MTLFRQIIPNSSVVSKNQEYEFLLMWLSEAGGIRQWMFSHTNGDEETEYQKFTIESLNSIRSIPSVQRKYVNVYTQSLDLESFNYVKSIMASNRVYVVKKDLSKIPVGIKEGSVPKPNQLKELTFKCQLIFKEDDLLNL